MVLICTDVAGMGIDIQDLNFCVNLGKATLEAENVKYIPKHIISALRLKIGASSSTFIHIFRTYFRIYLLKIYISIYDL